MKTATQEPRPDKVQVVKDLKEKIEKSVATVVTDYKGMSVAEISALRKKLRESNVEYLVVKNTMFKRALKDAGLADLAEHVEGPVAVAFAGADPVSPAKILTESFEDIEKPKLKVGVIENKIADQKLLAHLAKLSSREQLIAKVVGGIKSPLQGLVMVLSGVPRKFVYVLDAIKKQKEGGE